MAGPLRRLASSLNLCRLRFRGQEGFTLVETVVSAALLATIALGVYAGIDGPAAVSGTNQARTIADGLAQQDQDRMHQMRTVDLSNYQSSRTVTVQGINFSVASRSDWVTDSSGSISCTNSSTQANYMKITSTVTWPSIGSAKPVVLDSLVAPAPAAFGTNQGNLSVQILDPSGNGVSGFPVTLGAPVSSTLSTNAVGCAFFGYIPAGNYTATWSQQGWVDPGGNNSISVPTSVTAGSTTVVSQSYAPAASIAVSFDTQVGSNPPQPAQAAAVSVAAPGLPAPGMRTFTSSTPQSTITAGSLFPFTTGYGVYAGSCTADSPINFNSNYFSSNPGQVATSPGGSYSVTVREPAINVLVTKNGSPLAGANVHVTPVACATDSFAKVTTNAQGALPNPGYPFGNYNVCADDGTRRVTVSNVQNGSPAGTSSVPIVIPTAGGTLGTCP